jgi:hypothetical protein
MKISPSRSRASRSTVRSKRSSKVRLFLSPLYRPITPSPAAANDWHLPQALPAEPAASLHLSAQHRYGFLDAHAGYFAGGSGAANDVDELDGAAESLAPAERRRRRLAREDAKWDEEHYACVAPSRAVRVG